MFQHVQLVDVRGGGHDLVEQGTTVLLAIDHGLQRAAERVGFARLVAGDEQCRVHAATSGPVGRVHPVVLQGLRIPADALIFDQAVTLVVQGVAAGNFEAQTMRLDRLAVGVPLDQPGFHRKRVRFPGRRGGRGVGVGVLDGFFVGVGEGGADAQEHQQAEAVNAVHGVPPCGFGCQCT